MLRAILNKSWRQHPTTHQLYGHLPPITKTIQVRRNGHAGHCWRSRDELIRDVLLWTPPHMAVQKQDDQHEHTFSSYVRIRDVVLKTYLGRRTIGRSGERGSGYLCYQRDMMMKLKGNISIIKSCLLHSSLSLFLTIHLYHPSLLPSLPECILCPHRADVNLCWSVNISESMGTSPQENVTNEFFLASPAVPCVSCSSNSNGLWDRRQMAIQLFCGVWLPGFVQDSTWHYIIKMNIKVVIYVSHLTIWGEKKKSLFCVFVCVESVSVFMWTSENKTRQNFNKCYFPHEIWGAFQKALQSTVCPWLI